jgi:hypothetical protein
VPVVTHQGRQLPLGAALLSRRFSGSRSPRHLLVAGAAAAVTHFRMMRSQTIRARGDDTRHDMVFEVALASPSA